MDEPRRIRAWLFGVLLMIAPIFLAIGADTGSNGSGARILGLSNTVTPVGRARNGSNYQLTITIDPFPARVASNGSKASLAIAPPAIIHKIAQHNQARRWANYR